MSLAHRWEASDPRLSGTETYTGTWDRHAPGFEVTASTRVLENDAGRWVGTGAGMSGVFISTDAPLMNASTVILHGEGAYEGLTAFVLMELVGEGQGTFVGAIFSGEMPPLPESPAD